MKMYWFKNGAIAVVSFIILIDIKYSSSTKFTKYHANRSKKEAKVCHSSDDSAKGSTRFHLLLDSESMQCFQFGTRGPCGKNMIFYQNPVEPTQGFCDCDQGYRRPNTCSDYPVRRMIYIPTFNQCFPVFSQGPCLNGFWLNLEIKKNQPICEWNPCLKKQSQTLNSNPHKSHAYIGTPSRNEHPHKFWFYDPLRKSCFETLKRGYCPVGMTLEVTHDWHVPKCRRKSCHPTLTNIRSPLTCKPGNRYSYIFKGCLRNFLPGSKTRHYFNLG